MDSTTINVVIAGVAGRMGQALVSCLQEDEHLYFGGALEHPEHAGVGRRSRNEILPGKGNPVIESHVAPAVKELRHPVLIEFTTPHASMAHLEECAALGVPVVLGTTGFAPKEFKQIEHLAKKIPIVMSANFSIGVNLMIKAIEELAAYLPESYDLEIVEAHHRQKKDAPSGTALRLARALAEGRGKYLDKVICMHREGDVGERPQGQIGVQSIRGGDIVGDHTVYFAGPGERLEFTHRAHSRKNFAMGALRAARWLWQREGRVMDLAEPALYDMFDVLHLKKAGKPS